MSRWRDEEASSNPPRWLANRRIGFDRVAPSALGSIGRRRRKRPRAARATSFHKRRVNDELCADPAPPGAIYRGVLWAPHGTSAVPGAPYLPRVARPRATTPNGAAADATAPKTRDERRRSERRFEREARPPPPRAARARRPPPARRARSIRRGSENGWSRLPRPLGNDRLGSRPPPARPRPPPDAPPRPAPSPAPLALPRRAQLPLGAGRPGDASDALDARVWRAPPRGLRPPRTPPPRRDRGFFASDRGDHGALRRRRLRPEHVPRRAPLLFDAAPSTLVRRARRP